MAGNNNNSFYDIELLGQGFRYPKSITGALSVLGTLSAICFIVYSFLNADSEKLEQIRVWSSMFLGKEGKPTQSSGSKQIQFWTPSIKTSQSNGKLEDWEMDVTQEQVSEFGDKIYELDEVNGYRRYEVFGHGKSNKKWGWWWVVNVNNSFKPEQLSSVYREFWNNSDQNIYVEILNSSSSYN